MRTVKQAKKKSKNRNNNNNNNIEIILFSMIEYTSDGFVFDKKPFSLYIHTVFTVYIFTVCIIALGINIKKTKQIV